MSSAGSFDFLALPGEIRNRVYEYYLAVPVHQKQQSRQYLSHRLQTNILFVNRQIHEETADLFESIVRRDVSLVKYINSDFAFWSFVELWSPPEISALQRCTMLMRPNHLGISANQMGLQLMRLVLRLRRSSAVRYLDIDFEQMPIKEEDDETTMTMFLCRIDLEAFKVESIIGNAGTHGQHIREVVDALRMPDRTKADR